MGFSIGGALDVVSGGAFSGSGLAHLTGMEEGTIAGAVEGGVNKLLGEEVKASSGINPFNITTATGTGAFNPATGNIESQLTPEMQALFAGQQAQATGAFGRVAGAGRQAEQLSRGFLSEAGQFDPFAAAEEQFTRLDALLEPGRTKQRTGTAAGLLSTGRLGGTAGDDIQIGLEGELERQRQGLLSEQFTAAQDVQDRLVGRGTALGAFGTQQQLGQQALGTQSLQNVLGIDAQQQAALATAGGLTRAAPVEAQPGAFQSILQGGLTAGIGALAGKI